MRQTILICVLKFQYRVVKTTPLLGTGILSIAQIVATRTQLVLGWPWFMVGTYRSTIMKFFGDIAIALS